MSQFLLINNVNTTLAAPISSSATTISLSSALNLPILAQGQMVPITLNDAATQTKFEIVYATGFSSTTATVLRGQEGTSAQSWATGDYAFSDMTLGTTAPVVSFHQPTASETIPAGDRVIVMPGTLTADITLTLTNPQRVGSEATFFGSASAYSVTVSTGVTVGSPYILLPDGTIDYTFVIGASESMHGIRLEFDGANFRAQTFGRTIVAPAVNPNEAMPIGMLVGAGPTNIMSSSLVNTTIAQAIAANTNTLVEFNTVVFDDLLEFDTATYLWTIKAAGTYLVGAGINGSQTTVTTRSIDIFVNGVFRIRLQQDNGSAGTAVIVGTTIARCNVGDTIGIYYYSELADTLATTSGLTYAFIERLK